MCANIYEETAMNLVMELNCAYYEETNDSDITPFGFSTNGNACHITFMDASYFPCWDSENTKCGEFISDSVTEVQTRKIMLKEIESHMLELRESTTAIHEMVGRLPDEPTE